MGTRKLCQTEFFVQQISVDRCSLPTLRSVNNKKAFKSKVGPQSILIFSTKQDSKTIKYIRTLVKNGQNIFNVSQTRNFSCEFNKKSCIFPDFWREKRHTIKGQFIQEIV